MKRNDRFINISAQNIIDLVEFVIFDKRYTQTNFYLHTYKYLNIKMERINMNEI